MADIQERADALREKAAEKKVGEEEQTTKKRLRQTLSRRDAAIKNVEDFQDKTGIPTDDEVDGKFLSDESGKDLNLDEFKEKDDDDEV